MAVNPFPEDLRYSREHEWVRVEGERATVGITWFAQDQLGDVVYAELPSVGDRIEKDEPFGVVESVKTVSDLYAPLTGEVLETNDRLADAPEKVNEDPYGEGWMLVVKIENPDEIDELLDSSDYRAMVEGDD